MARIPRARMMGGDTFNLSIVTTTPTQTVTITQLTPTGQDTTIDWGDNSSTTIANGRTTAITHVYATAGTYAAKVAKPGIVTTLRIDVGAAFSCVSGNIRKLPNLTYLRLLDSPGFAANSGEIGSLTKLAYLVLRSCPGVVVAVGEIGTLTTLTALTLQSCIGVVVGAGEIAALTALTALNLTSCAGVAATTGISALTLVKTVTYANNLSQAQVDALLAAMYAARATYILTGATPTLDLLGTGNAAPSGVYQFSLTPATGNEMVWALVNDGLAEGFKKWTIQTA
jgi:hypothetical protein